MTEEATTAEVTTEDNSTAAPESTASAERPAETTEAQTAQPEPQQFYDPKDVPDELRETYKRMQGSYTKKMQEASSWQRENTTKVEAYDNFMRDPIGTMQQLAAQQGYQLTRAEAKAAAEGAEGSWQPGSWDDVIARAKQEAKQELMKELDPYFQETKKTKQTQIEAALDQEFPEWRAHEQDMIKLINEHPTLASDPSMLARLAIPKDVIESRATQEALKKLQQRSEASKSTSGSTTTKTANDTKPGVFSDINEAVAFAKERMRREGIH